LIENQLIFIKLIIQGLIVLSNDNPKKSSFVKDSAIVNERISLFSEDASIHDILYGGRLLQIVEKVVLKAAKLHAKRDCLPIGIDGVHFYAPVKRGDILRCSASVNRVWDNKMEVGIRVVADDFFELEQKDILSAYFTLAVFDEENHPEKVLEVIPKTKAEKKRFYDAEKRRQLREKNSFKINRFTPFAYSIKK
jgi:acyl-CoA hydrolase